MSISHYANLSQRLIASFLIFLIFPFSLVAEGRTNSYVPDTNILMADGLEKQIKYIIVGDRVLNPISGKIAKVVNVLESIDSGQIVAITVGNKSVRVTEDHPVKTSEGLVVARDIKTGDVLTLNGTSAEVSRVQYLPGKAKQLVYNIRLEGDDQLDNHLILSNGIVTGDLTATEIINTIPVEEEPVVVREEITAAVPEPTPTASVVPSEPTPVIN